MSTEQTDPASEGARAFRAWLEGPPKQKQADVAKTLGVSQQTVSGWLRGTILPGLLYRVKLKTLAKIAPELWLPADKREAVRLSPEEEKAVLDAGTEDAKGAA